ncbi:hypothetical protein J3458_020253 [Metarhizium acridum]|uniref:uncharacterized protein n=1 Tax=Metarhizium acridum TaxID=92637 RepID=UPI001C6AA7E6|nr:hypothetical protein J3458_020253 [Metarhizium acridum]
MTFMKEFNGSENPSTFKGLNYLVRNRAKAKERAGMVGMASVKMTKPLSEEMLMKITK